MDESELSESLKEFWDSVEDGSLFAMFDDSEELRQMVERIVENNPRIADGI